jgi:hypothetical protein
MNAVPDLLPLAIGAGSLLLAARIQLPKWPNMNRPVFGMVLIFAAVCLWLSSAMMLVRSGEFYAVLNMAYVVLLFLGPTQFLQQPPTAKTNKDHGVLGNCLMYFGLALGIAHSAALLFHPPWSAFLLDLYRRVGIY